MPWPTVGGDYRSWGQKLLAILQSTHKEDGGLRDEIVDSIAQAVAEITPQGPPGEMAIFMPGESVPTADALNDITTPSEGEVHVAEDTGDAHGWTGSTWINLGPFRGPQGVPGELVKALADTYYADRDDTAAALANVPNVVIDTLAVDDTPAQAAAAAVDAAMVGKDVLVSESFVSEYNRDLSFAMRDQNGYLLWFEAGMDGNPTGRVVRLLGEAAGFVVEQLNTDLNPYSLAFQDANGRFLWPLVGLDGLPTQWTVDQIAEKLPAADIAAESYRDASGATWPISSGPDIVCWGDSMTAQGYPAILQTITGHTVRNGGVGGEGSAGIVARQGGEPYTVLPVGGSIPASGGVQITFAYRPGWPLLQGAGTNGGTWTGTLAGVPGTITLTQPTPEPQYQHHADDYYTFTRTTAGSAVAVARPVPFYSDFAQARRGDMAVFWYGRNDTYDPDAADHVAAAVAQSVLHLSPPDKRFLVLSVTTGTGEAAGNSKYDIAMAINAELRARYGRRYVDLQNYLIDYGLADAGITPTAQDTTDIANRTVPASLRSDGVHLTAAGRQVVAEQVDTRMREFGWLD